MKRLFILLFAVIGLFNGAAMAQDVKRPDSYNYMRGVEAATNGNYEEALLYFNKEIEDSPKNGYAFSWIAAIYTYQEEYGRALTAADKAIKYIPKKDKEYRKIALGTRARIYQYLEKTDKVLEDLNQLIKEQPDCTDAYEARGQLYYEQGEYDLADEDYRKIISLDPDNVKGYMGIGRNANDQGRYEEAIEQFDYVTKLANNYSSAYSFRAESYIGLKQYDKAADDIIQAFSRDSTDMKAMYWMGQVADSAFSTLEQKLKEVMLKEPDRAWWPFWLGVINEQRMERYQTAIVYYKDAMEKDAAGGIAYAIAECYSTIGNYGQAINYCQQAIRLNSTDYTYPILLAYLMSVWGWNTAAISIMDGLIEAYPYDARAYFERGGLKDNSNDIEGAIEDYSMAIMLSPDDISYYFPRALSWQLQGYDDEAKKDFEKVIELDSIREQVSTSPFAYYYLGQKEKAIALMDSVLENADKRDYYNAAWLYSVMGETEKSLGYLRKSLESGFRDFALIARNRGFDNIKDTEEFKSLIEEYKEKFAARDKAEEEAALANMPRRREGVE